MAGKCGLMRSSIVTVAKELKAEEMVLCKIKAKKNITDVFKTQHTTKHDGILSITSTFYPTMMVFYVIIFSFALDWKGFKDKKTKQIEGRWGMFCT